MELPNDINSSVSPNFVIDDSILGNQTSGNQILNKDVIKASRSTPAIMNLRANVIPGSQNESKVVEESVLDVTPPANYDSMFHEEQKSPGNEYLVEASMEQTDKEQEAVFNTSQVEVNI